MKKLYTIKDLEEIFQVSRYAINAWRKDGMPEIKIGGTIRFDIDEVMEWTKEKSKKEDVK